MNIVDEVYTGDVIETHLSKYDLKMTRHSEADNQESVKDLRKHYQGKARKVKKRVEIDQNNEDADLTPAHDWNLKDYQFQLLDTEKDPTHGSFYQFEAADLIMGRVPGGESLEETAKDDGKLYPVYVLLMHSGTPLASIIKTITNDRFSHCVIAFDPSMHQMYSFGHKLDAKHPIGTFICDDIRHKFFLGKNIDYAMYCVPVTKPELQRMQSRLDFFVKNQSKFKYDFAGLITNFFHISYNPKYSFFCSRFVADILHAGKPGESLIHDPSLIRPMDFTNMPFAYYVTGGIIDHYNEKDVRMITKRILREHEIRPNTLDESCENPYFHEVLRYQVSGLDEAAFDALKRTLTSFKIRLKPDGSIQVSRREYQDLDRHYKSAKKMLDAYRKANNVEGMKSELARIYYMSELIQKYYLSNSDADKDITKCMADLRSVMINVIHKAVKDITALEPEFNFQTYYATTKYSDDIEIPKTAIAAIGKTIKTLLV